MSPASFEELKKSTLDLLKRSLPAGLTYHHAGHTADVLQQSERIAIEEGVTNEHDLLLLKIAALFHDTGFLYTYREHEKKSCEIMRRKLGNKLDESELTEVCKMIMATRIPQTPLDHLGEIICDADLDYLGRDDFPEISDGLRLEFLQYGIVKDDLDWEEKQISFLKHHTYFTDNSKQLRQSVKKDHLEKLVTIFSKRNT
ncbi:MAG TPA: HD domain-containing protein [Panacibacter sp.]|nr:HD domain-containing protein [Panacibacter sp.]HNP44132.1 HD domain-containing protein [Panacibacter sp.]